MVGGGGTSWGGVSAAEFFLNKKIKAVENLSGLHGFFILINTPRP